LSLADEPQRAGAGWARAFISAMGAGTPPLIIASLFAAKLTSV
jgi:hypothetical protein